MNTTTQSIMDPETAATPTSTAAGVPALALRDQGTEKPEKNKGGRPKGRKRQYDFKLYATRADALRAMETLRLHMTTEKDGHGKVVKLGDRQAAQYFIDQLFGTAVNRRENVGDPNAGRQTVIIMLPPKFSELTRGGAVEIHQAEPARLSEKSGETPSREAKADQKKHLGIGGRQKRSR